MKALQLPENPGISPGPAASCMDQPSLDFPGKIPLSTLPPASSFFLVEIYCLPQRVSGKLHGPCHTQGWKSTQSRVISHDPAFHHLKKKKSLWVKREEESIVRPGGP